MLLRDHLEFLNIVSAISEEQQCDNKNSTLVRALSLVRTIFAN